LIPEERRREEWDRNLSFPFLPNAVTLLSPWLTKNVLAVGTGSVPMTPDAGTAAGPFKRANSNPSRE